MFHIPFSVLLVSARNSIAIKPSRLPVFAKSILDFFHPIRIQSSIFSIVQPARLPLVACLPPFDPNLFGSSKFWQSLHSFQHLSTFELRVVPHTLTSRTVIFPEIERTGSIFLSSLIHSLTPLETLLKIPISLLNY